MSSQPDVKVRDWISVSGVDCLVMAVYPECIDVGYYHQNQMKAIKQEVIWEGSHWKFTSSLEGSYLRGLEEVSVKRGPPQKP